MNAALLSSLVLVCAADEPPAPKVPVGKDTTFVTGPLDKNGYIDYEAALNDRLGAGITPDKNANVLIWKALGPRPDDGSMPPEYFRRLGIAEPPKAGDYFVSGRGYARRTKLSDEDARAFYDQQARAASRAWSAKELPRVADWLALNEKPLAVVIEATRRPAYFNPLVSNRKDDISSIMGCLIPSTQSGRALAQALVARALLRAHEGKLDAAWVDLIACHRLGLHLMHGGTFIESLVGIAVRAIAANATLAYLEHTDLTSQQLLAKLKELQDLPAAPPAADVVDLGERLNALDVLQMVRSGKDGPDHPTPEGAQALDMIEWEPAFRKMNAAFDQMVAAMRLTDRAAREKQLNAVGTDLDEVARKNRDLNILQKWARANNPGKFVGKEIGDVLSALVMPGLQKCQWSFDRATQTDRNLQLAFALAAYRKDTGRYPAKLADLAPKYMAAVPDDLFTGKPLTYQPAEKGYFFYSVGENGKDDGGRGRDDEPRGDDLGVRVPLPALKP
ncbi:hypothetical protein R5W23_002549 [Gemmata sp. JC673]|uniref:Type II secretion system protein GspG C-terminal domain-containing protein n=1 Tax=Gemmata algarum TaxID=2975278 RepID=A0ABU5F257_9BACT|nr:hypothetical protein [Gemmata algarum]MDY3561274.1 hypothetical protein [Gemmata algarum]